MLSPTPLQQLALGFPTNNQQVFANFLPAKNLQPVEHLARLVAGLAGQAEFNLVYLWGSAATGKTHLLNASCQAAASLGASSVYLNLNQVSCLTSLVMQDLPQLIALDNLEAIAANARFEEAVFHLFNLAKQQNCLFVVAAKANPANLGLILPDLASRLAWGITYQLEDLTDEQKLEVLALKAKARGIEIAEEVKKHLLYHCPRDLNQLLNLLNHLDAASLQAQRRLTLPFVRDLLKN